MSEPCKKSSNSNKSKRIIKYNYPDCPEDKKGSILPVIMLLKRRMSCFLSIETEYFKKFKGYALIVNPNGTKYTGHIKKGKRHGKGHQLQTNGNLIYGLWKNDKIIHVWKIVYSNGDIYTGEFKHGTMIRSGKGKMVYPNGNYYKGEWENDEYHGFGIYKGPGGPVNSCLLYTSPSPRD